MSNFNLKKGELLNAALVFATNSHANQYDRGGNPYILHPLRLLHTLNTNDEELQCIAILHDCVEDCGVTYEDLRNIGMTDRIICGVRCMTKIAGETYDEYKQKILGNRDAMLVKKEDLRHNTDIRRLKGVSDKDIARTARYYQFFTEIETKLSQTN